VAPPPAAGSVANGQAIFQSAAAGCAGCHSGTDFTDDLNHAPLNPMSLEADDVFTSANTPALHALFLRAPFFHDGRAPDLMNLLTRSDAAGHGNTAALSVSDLTDLVAYLETL
jgi:cytochrome c peroxidase